MSQTTHRRGFLGRMIGAAAALGLPITEISIHCGGAAGRPDDWINEVKGTHRCLFDFPQHKNGFAAAAHPELPQHLHGGVQDRRRDRWAPSARSTAWAARSSIPLAFNDAMWAKYGLGEYTGLKDASGKAYTRNVFNRPTQGRSATC